MAQGTEASERTADGPGTNSVGPHHRCATFALVIITTTHSVDGYRILHYYQPVICNLVVGAGFFSDLEAGLTDFFGGKSTMYQDRLREMHSEALRELEAKATAVGANCLVAVRFDLDQLSGKGMQMLMLNAVATPVTIKTDAQIADEAAQIERAREDHERAEAARAERFAGLSPIQALLADEEIARQARKTRQVYGRAVCASFLKRKATELGLGDVEVSEDDIPDSF
jgi:uncharacterized protein YbjQ (UPF0145 family)